MQETTRETPKVCVVTPVYNTAKYLAECIESVLAQTVDHFDYLIVDNASTDDSLEIARSYAAKDQRIRVVAFDEHLEQIPNYNRALEQISPGFDYCKIVQADDAILPNCLEDMLALAESDSGISFVSAYTILQDQVFLDGLDYTESVLDGKEVCRQYLFDHPYLFGTPTTCLYRMKDVNATREFFPENSPLADADAAFQLTLNGKFGFVHQVLTIVRLRSESISNDREHYELDALTRRVLYEKYGSEVLTGDEYRAIGKRLLWRHRRVLGKGALGFYKRDFWDFHRIALQSAGKDFSIWDVVLGSVIVFLRGFLNIESLLRKLKERLTG